MTETDLEKAGRGVLQRLQTIGDRLRLIPGRLLPKTGGDLDRIAFMPDAHARRAIGIWRQITLGCQMPFPHIPPLGFRYPADPQQRLFDLDPARFPYRCRLPATAHDFGRHARRDRQIWNVPGDNSPGSDNRTPPDRHAVQNDRIGTDPDIIADRNAERLVRLIVDRYVRIVETMIETDDRHQRRNTHTVSAPDLSGDACVGVDRTIGADFHISPHEGVPRNPGTISEDQR